MKTSTFIKAWFQRVILRRYWLCFLVMGLSFLAFGMGTLNLIYVFKANADLLLNNGWMALMDGGLAQLLEILATGYASLIAYIVFKACEHSLVHGLANDI
jgi:hypothetical protein